MLLMFLSIVSRKRYHFKGLRYDNFVACCLECFSRVLRNLLLWSVTQLCHEFYSFLSWINFVVAVVFLLFVSLILGCLYNTIPTLTLRKRFEGQNIFSIHDSNFAYLFYNTKALKFLSNSPISKIIVTSPISRS